MMGGALDMHTEASTTSMRPIPPGCEATQSWFGQILGPMAAQDLSLLEYRH